MILRLTQAGYNRELARKTSRGLASVLAAVAVWPAQPGAVSFIINGQMAPLKLGEGNVK